MQVGMVRPLAGFAEEAGLELGHDALWRGRGRHFKQKHWKDFGAGYSEEPTRRGSLDCRGFWGVELVQTSVRTS